MSSAAFDRPGFRRRRSALRPSVRRTAAVLAAGTLVVTWVASPALGSGRATAAPSLVASKAASSLHNRCHRSAKDVPACGVLWGLFTAPTPHTGGNWLGAYKTVEQRIGRRFDIVKLYTDWQPGSTFPNEADRQLAAGGRRILDVSWNAINYHNRHRISDASIASGAWDKSVILPEAGALKSFHHKIFLDFNHEFDNSETKQTGTPAQYKAAYRHIENVMKRAGVRNVIWAWVSTGDVYHAKRIKESYPGPRYVDWIGYDPYNFVQCQGRRNWRTPYQVFEPFYRWVRHQKGMRSKPLMLGEYGSNVGPKVGKWYASVAGALKRLPRIKAVMQFSADPGGYRCDFILAHNASSMAGFRSSSHAPYVLGTR